MICKSDSGWKQRVKSLNIMYIIIVFVLRTWYSGHILKMSFRMQNESYLFEVYLGGYLEVCLRTVLGLFEEKNQGSVDRRVWIGLKWGFERCGGFKEIFWGKMVCIVQFFVEGDLGVRITQFWSAAAACTKVIRVNPGKLCNHCFNLYFALYSSCVQISAHFHEITYDEKCFCIIIDWIKLRKNYIELICGILYPTLFANCYYYWK